MCRSEANINSFFNCSPHYLLTQGLSLNLTLVGSARLARQRLLRILLCTYPSLSAGVIGDFYVESGDLNVGLPLFPPGISPTELSLLF